MKDALYSFKHMIAIGPCRLAALALSLATSVQAQFTKPNVVFILMDNLGYGELGMYSAKACSITSQLSHELGHTGGAAKPDSGKFAHQRTGFRGAPLPQLGPSAVCSRTSQCRRTIHARRYLAFSLLITPPCVPTLPGATANVILSIVPVNGNAPFNL